MYSKCDKINKVLFTSIILAFYGRVIHRICYINPLISGLHLAAVVSSELQSYAPVYSYALVDGPAYFTT
jgi:hypothetical protein